MENYSFNLLPRKKRNKKTAGTIVENKKRNKTALELLIKKYIDDKKLPYRKRKKLYLVSYLGTDIEEYLSALTEDDVVVKFRELYPKAKLKNIETIRIPNEWEIRWPLILKRIGKVATMESIANYKKWVEELNMTWTGITAHCEKRNKARFEEWIKVWENIGYARFDNTTRFDLLELN